MVYTRIYHEGSLWTITHQTFLVHSVLKTGNQPVNSKSYKEPAVTFIKN